MVSRCEITVQNKISALLSQQHHEYEKKQERNLIDVGELFTNILHSKQTNYKGKLIKS